MANTYAYSKAESDAKNQETFREIKQTTEAISAGEGGKLYDTLADAQALDPKPVDGTIFQVKDEGYYSFQSSESGGTRFEREYIDKSDLTPPSIEGFRKNRNLHNPDLDYINQSIQTDGSLINSANYNSYKIECEPNTEYNILYNDQHSSTLYRRTVFFDSNEDVISYVETQQFTTPAGCVFFISMYEVIYTPENVFVNKVGVPYEPYSSGFFIDENAADPIIKLSDIPITSEIATSSNLYNPDTRTENASLNEVNGVVTPQGSGYGYDVSDFIEVESGEEYHFLYNAGSVSSICRRAVYYDTNKNYIVNVESPSSIVIPAGTAFVRLLFNNENHTTDPLIQEEISFGLSSDDFEYFDIGFNTYDKGGERLAKVSDIPSPSDIGLSKAVTLQNSDKILYTGSSSVEGFYQPKGKLWAHKVQDFIDYVFIPYGWSGNSAQDIADKILTDTPSPSASGAVPSIIKPTFTFVGQTLNDEGEHSNATDEEYMGYLEKLLKACRMLGGKPIVGTAYKSSNRINLETTLAELASKYDAYFMPTSRVNDLVYDPAKTPRFYGSAHPAIRTNELYTTPTLQYLKNIKAPKQAILVFNARNPLDTNQDLVVTDNYERAKKFKTISVGEKHIQPFDEDRYDDLTPSDYSISGNQQSEWLALMRGQDVSLKDKALIEFILPVVGTEEISIEISGTGITKYHLLNNVTNTWDEVSPVDGSINITQQKYTDFDKVRVLVEGSGVTMNDAKAIYVGGSEKERKETSIETPFVGTVIRDAEGFDEALTGFTNSATNEVYLPSVKYGEEFNDLPKFINAPDRAVVVLGGEPLSYSISSSEFGQAGSLGYRKLRATFCARINPKIYNPTEYANWVGANNPYTDVSWYEEDSYDFATIVFAFENGQNPNPQAKRNVGLFWTYQSVDILLPPKSVSLDLQIYRDITDAINSDMPLEICDLIIEII